MVYFVDSLQKREREKAEKDATIEALQQVCRESLGKSSVKHPEIFILKQMKY